MLLQCGRYLLLVAHEGRQLPLPGLVVFLKVLDSPIVGLHRVPHDGVLQGGRLLVELDARRRPVVVLRAEQSAEAQRMERSASFASSLSASYSY